MIQYILTIIDTVGVQDYIFATNNLRQNAGASFLADCATGTWVKEALDSVANNQHNVKSLSSKEDLYDGRSIEIEKDNLQAELIYSGGGNAVLLFDTLKRATHFSKELTRKVLIRAPGLRVVIHHTPFEWGDVLGDKHGVMDKALRAMKDRKRSTPPEYPMLGLGVSARCVFSGWPAVGYDKDNRPVSTVAAAKEKQEFDLDKNGKIKSDTSHGRLLDALKFRDFIPARDFDMLGVSPDESSLIAIIHADGNGMGKRIEDIRDAHKTSADNRNYLNELRCFSASVKKASIIALQATVDLLIANLKKNETQPIYFIPAEAGQDEIKGAITLAYDAKDTKRYALPFRPIVLGGDDTAFVCEGRLGLVLAHYYLQKFSEQTLSDKKRAHCRAGVALVPLHFPFARAYDLAEELCKSARSSINQWKDKDEGITVIDWHFAIGGMVRKLDDVRKLEYTSDEGLRSAREGDLLMRPLRLDDYEKEWRSWSIFIQTVREFKTGDVWRNRHNKVKALREALRKGEKAVRQFRRVYSIDTLPALHKEYKSFPELGWQGEQCGYFDAIEAMDRLIELDTTRSLAPLSIEQEAA